MARTTQPIEQSTAKAVMTVFGVLLVLIGIYLQSLNISINGDPITVQVVGFFIIFAVLLQYLELGLKRYSDISKLKAFSVQQKITFWVATVILIQTILNMAGVWQTFSTFTSGFIIIIGLTITLEAWN